MLADKGFHWDWAHLGLADHLDAVTASGLFERVRPKPGTIPSLSTGGAQ
jgi:hypothetical protein